MAIFINPETSKKGTRDRFNKDIVVQNNSGHDGVDKEDVIDLVNTNMWSGLVKKDSVRGNNKFTHRERDREIYLRFK